MKPTYDPDNWQHATIMAHRDCTPGDCKAPGFTICADDPEYRELHDLEEPDDEPSPLDTLNDLVAEIRTAAHLPQPGNEASPAEPCPPAHSAGSLVSTARQLIDEHQGIARCKCCGGELVSTFAPIRPDGYCGACARELFRCAGTGIIVPLGIPFDKPFACACGTLVRLVNDGVNYRVAEHERGTLPALIPDGDLSVR